MAPDPGQQAPISGSPTPPGAKENIAAALPAPSPQPSTPPTSLAPGSNVATVQEGTASVPPAVKEMPPPPGQIAPADAISQKDVQAAKPAPTAPVPQPPIPSQPVEAPSPPSEPRGPVAIASVPRVADRPIAPAQVSPGTSGIRLAEEQRVEAAEAPRRTGAEAKAAGEQREKTAGGQGGGGEGGQGERTAGGQGREGAVAKATGETGGGRAEATVPVIPPVANRLGPEVSRGSALPLAPKAREEVQATRAETEPSGAVPGSSPLSVPDPAPPAPVERLPFARQPDPEGRMPPGPFQTARTRPIPPPPEEEPSVTPKTVEPPKPPSGPPGPVASEAVAGVPDKPVTATKVEPASPGMQPVEEQTGRTAEPQRRRGEEAQGRTIAGGSGREGAGEKESKPAEEQGNGEARGRGSKGAGEKGTKGGGEERVTELKPAPAIPPVAEQPKAEVSRPPVPRPDPKISEETQLPTTVAESKRAAPESAPVLPPEPTPPRPVAEVPAKEPASAPAVPQAASLPTPSAEKSGATPSPVTENLPAAGPSKPGAASAAPAPPAVEPKPSPPAPQPQLRAPASVAREQGGGTERERVGEGAGEQRERLGGAPGSKGAEAKTTSERGGETVEAQGRRGAEAKTAMGRGRRSAEAPEANVAEGRGSAGAGAQGQGGTGAEGVKAGGEAGSQSAGPGAARAAGAEGQGRTVAGGTGSQAAEEQGAGAGSQVQGTGLAGGAGGPVAQSGPGSSAGSPTPGSGAGMPGGGPTPGPSGQAPLGAAPASSPKPVQTSPPPVVGLPGISIQIDRPQAGRTGQAIQPLVGRVSGGAAKGIVVHVNGRQQLLDLWENGFEGEVVLRPGRNQIRVVAMGARGPAAEKSVEVEYVPPPPSSALRIIRPTDGTVFSAAGQDLIEVEGEVSDPNLQQASVAFNEFAFPVTIRGGRFSVVVPAIAPEITIWAEAHGSSGSHASDPVRIRREPYKAARAYVLLYLPAATRRIDARLWLAQRANPADVDSVRKVTSHFPAGTPGGDRTSTLFAIPATQAGAYTLALDYRIPAGEAAERGWCLVIVPGTDGYRNLRLGPFQLSGKGRAILTKFLLPYGIFWDEDFWFTAFAEGSESFSKFRHSDGVSWTEMKVEPEFPAAK
jgi:hypothetical protein